MRYKNLCDECKGTIINHCPEKINKDSHGNYDMCDKIVNCEEHWEILNPEIDLDYYHKNKSCYAKKIKLCSECKSKIKSEEKFVLLKDIIKLCPRNVYIDCIKDMQGYYEINVVGHGIIFKSKHHQEFTLDEILNMRVTNFNVSPDGEFTIDIE